MSQFSQPLNQANAPFVGVNPTGVDPTQAVTNIGNIQQSYLQRLHERGMQRAQLKMDERRINMGMKEGEANRQHEAMMQEKAIQSQKELELENRKREDFYRNRDEELSRLDRELQSRLTRNTREMRIAQAENNSTKMAALEQEHRELTEQKARNTRLRTGLDIFSVAWGGGFDVENVDPETGESIFGKLLTHNKDQIKADQAADVALGHALTNALNDLALADPAAPTTTRDPATPLREPDRKMGRLAEGQVEPGSLAAAASIPEPTQRSTDWQAVAARVAPFITGEAGSPETATLLSGLLGTLEDMGNLPTDYRDETVKMQRSELEGRAVAQWKAVVESAPDETQARRMLTRLMMRLGNQAPMAAGVEAGTGAAKVGVEESGRQFMDGGAGERAAQPFRQGVRIYEEARFLMDGERRLMLNEDELTHQADAVQQGIKDALMALSGASNPADLVRRLSDTDSTNDWVTVDTGSGRVNVDLSDPSNIIFKNMGAENHQKVLDLLGDWARDQMGRRGDDINLLADELGDDWNMADGRVGRQLRDELDMLDSQLSGLNRTELMQRTMPDNLDALRAAGDEEEAILRDIEERRREVQNRTY